MLKFVNLDISGYLSFVEDGETTPEYHDGALAEFVSLGKRGLRASENGIGFAAFAVKYGSLTNPGEGIALPEGIESFFDGLRTLSAGESPATLRVESRAFWKFHIDAMRELALLHMLACEPKERFRTNGVMTAKENCIVYDSPDGGRSCLYYAANGFLPVGAGSRMEVAGRPLRDYGEGLLPPAVESYLTLLGRPFVFSAPFAGGDTLDHRIEWLGEHCREILESYAGKYLLAAKGLRGSLLSFLQDSLIETISSSEYLQFCILCGGCAREEYMEGNRSFDTNVCRMDLYRSRDHYRQRLRDEGGFSDEEIDRMLDTRHVSRRSSGK